MINIHPELLKICPWIKDNIEYCSNCIYRDPPQLERTEYMITEEIWKKSFLDPDWQFWECVAMCNSKIPIDYKDSNKYKRKLTFE